MTLPASRDVTFAAGSQVPSATLNNLQDSIIGANHGEITAVVGAAAFNLKVAPDSVSPTFDATDYVWDYASADYRPVYADLALKPGDRVQEFRLNALSGGTGGDLECFVYEIASDGTKTLLASVSHSASGAWSQVLVESATFPFTVAANAHVMAFVQSDTGESHSFYSLSIDYDRP